MKLPAFLKSAPAVGSWREIDGMKITAAAPLLALALVGCSGEASDTPADASDQVAVAEPSEAASGESKPDCSSLPRPDSKPDNDLIGIDLGMSADDALRISQCSKEGYEVTIEEDRSVTLPDGSHPRGMIELRKPNDRVNIFVMGLPNQETVYGLVREKKFAAGEEPTLEQMRADLVGKYGPLTDIDKFTRNPYKLAQSFTPDGQPIPDNEIGDVRCVFYFGQNNNLGQIFEPCGFTKKIEVKARYGNEALSGGFNIWLGDQNKVFTEARRVVSAVGAMHQQRRDAAVEKAASSDRTPEL